MNKKIILTICITILFLNFSVVNTELTPNSIIVTRYQVIENQYLEKCSHETRDFLKMKKYDCAFFINGSKFTIVNKIEFDSSQKLASFWRYLPEGPLIDSKSELDKDISLLNYYKLNNYSAKINLDFKSIIEQNDTLKIEKIFEIEKLILVKAPNITKGRKILFQYK